MMKSDKNKRGLSEEEKGFLERSFAEARQDVGEEDIEYVLKKGGGRFEDWTKATGLMQTVYRQDKLLYLMLRDWWNDEYELPWRVVAAITACLLYVLNPFDLIPDFIPVLGAIDDLFVVGLTIALIRADLRRYCRKNDLDPSEYGL
jgi:uncharacterized membrane protein YkvA (DUF1232 family)